MNNFLRVSCTYQGGKQRFASPIVDHLLTATTEPDSLFYDLCCGSGAISIELVNRGMNKESSPYSWHCFSKHNNDYRK